MSVCLEKEEYLYQEEVAKRLNIALSTLKVKVRAKEIPLPIKLKSKSIWKLSEIEQYLKSQS